MKKIIPAVLLILHFTRSDAQNVENTAWLMFVSSVKFNPHWGGHIDIQFRSGNDVDYLKNVMIRPGVTYFFNSKQSATLGYLFVETNRNLAGSSNNMLTEHRIWQQFVQNHKISKLLATHRFRFEQRFIEQPSGAEIVAQRFRYFARFIIPLKSYQESFSRGPFLAAQNEVFLNIQGKDKLNQSVYDQNRLYLAAGFRLNSKIDLEAGYLDQSIKGLTANTVNHVVQLAVYTRF